MDESETKKKDRKNVRGKKRPTFKSSELVADMGIEDGLCNAAFDLFLLWQTLPGTRYRYISLLRDTRARRLLPYVPTCE